MEIIFGGVENLNIPSDRAHRVALDTSIFTVDTLKKVNLLLEFH